MKTFRSLTIESQRKSLLPPVLKKYNSPKNNSNYSESRKRLNRELLFNNIENNSYCNNGNNYHCRYPNFYNDGNFNNRLNILLTSSGRKFEKIIITEKIPNTTKKDYSNRFFEDNQTERNDISLPHLTIDNKLKTNLKLVSACSNYKKNTGSCFRKFSDSKRRNNVDYLYKSIFTTKPIVKQNYNKYIDNKLNLVYSENLQQFKLIMNRRNKLETNNRVISSKNGDDNEKIIEQVNDIKTKINFMKSIMDYSTPHFLLTKAKAIVQKLHKEGPDEILSTPVEKREHEAREKNELRKNYFANSMNIISLKKI